MVSIAALYLAHEPVRRKQRKVCFPGTLMSCRNTFGLHALIDLPSVKSRRQAEIQKQKTSEILFSDASSRSLAARKKAHSVKSAPDSRAGALA